MKKFICVECGKERVYNINDDACFATITGTDLSSLKVIGFTYKKGGVACKECCPDNWDDR